jgi:translation elongation factor EF-G
VVLDIKPMPRGSGFTFAEKITGGVVPRNYIPSVEEGVIDGLKHGPLGFPVVDIAVTLIDGSYHTVDSSDMAFRTAGRIGVVDALPQCHPVLLEPIHSVEIICPNDATAKINAILSGRRGQILGFDTARAGRLGLREGDDAGIGDRRSDRGGAFGDGGCRHVLLQVRSHGRTHRPHRGSNRRGKTRGGSRVHAPTKDHDDFGSTRSKIINVIMLQAGGAISSAPLCYG